MKNDMGRIPKILFDQPLDKFGFFARVGFYFPFAFFGIRLLVAELVIEDIMTFLNFINLPFHEAGHAIFFFLPSVGVSIMGSAFQVMLPLICALTLFFKTKDKFGAYVCLFWAGQNLLEVALYHSSREHSLFLTGR